MLSSCFLVVIYRCRDMADNCGMCLALAEKYECGWCQSSVRCEVKDQCERGSAVWLNRSQTCPNPEVLSFSPKLGPWEGDTNITIEGINLGKKFEDIYNGVSIAGINCEPYSQLYIKTTQIVCRVCCCFLYLMSSIFCLFASFVDRLMVLVLQNPAKDL